MKSLKLFFIIVLSIGFTKLSAQNYNDAYRLSEEGIDFDARTLALGNSTIATWGSFSSTLVNPGALATVQKSIFTLSINTNTLQNSADFFNSNLTADKNNNNLNQLSLILPLPTKKGSAALAFGYNQSRDYNSFLKFDAFNGDNNSMIQDLTNFNDDIAYDLYLSYPVYNANDVYIEDRTNIAGRLNQSGNIDEEGSQNSWVMSGAFEIQKNIYVGGTFNIISGKYKSNRTYQEDDYTNNFYTGLLDPFDPNTNGFESFYINDIIDWNISGWDFRLGLLYEMNNMLSFGATIKFPSYFSISERYSIYGESEFSDIIHYIDYPGAKNEYEISTPMEISSGVSFSLPLVKINASLKLVDYSQLEFTKGFDSFDLDQKNADIKNVFESVVNYNFGAEFTIPYPSMKLRGGFIYNPSPYIGDSSEFDKKYFTMGVGLPLSKNLILDFAYAHGWWKNIGDNYSANLSRTYQSLNLDKVAITVNYSFM